MAPTTSPSRQITLDDLTVQNLGLLRKLNSVIFPIPYSEKFYKESVNVRELAKLGMFTLALPQWFGWCWGAISLISSIFQRRLCWSSEMSI